MNFNPSYFISYPYQIQDQTQAFEDARVSEEAGSSPSEQFSEAELAQISAATKIVERDGSEGIELHFNPSYFISSPPQTIDVRSIAVEESADQLGQVSEEELAQRFTEIDLAEAQSDQESAEALNFTFNRNYFLSTSESIDNTKAAEKPSDQLEQIVDAGLNLPPVQTVVIEKKLNKSPKKRRLSTQETSPAKKRRIPLEANQDWKKEADDLKKRWDDVNDQLKMHPEGDYSGLLSEIKLELNLDKFFPDQSQDGLTEKVEFLLTLIHPCPLTKEAFEKELAILNKIRAACKLPTNSPLKKWAQQVDKTLIAQYFPSIYYNYAASVSDEIAKEVYQMQSINESSHDDELKKENCKKIIALLFGEIERFQKVQEVAFPISNCEFYEWSIHALGLCHKRLGEAYLEYLHYDAPNKNPVCIKLAIENLRKSYCFFKDDAENKATVFKLLTEAERIAIREKEISH